MEFMICKQERKVLEEIVAFLETFSREIISRH